jgi:lycopene cyclase domain-containing protein
MEGQLSYVFLDAGVLCGAVVLTWGHPMWRDVMSRWFVSRAVALFVFWCLVDYTAVALRLWSFPQGTTLAVRLHGLPVEEYTVFVVHTVLTLAVLRAMELRRV